MRDSSDMELVREYVRVNSEPAFEELVRRHINLVYSTALRHAGMAAQAEEIAQAVFIILARKAGRLRSDTVLESWLYATTRLTALSFIRGERRRQFREQEVFMQSAPQNSAGDSHSAWNEIAPLLDEAMSRLGRKDRDAVVLRFLKQKSVRDVAIAMRVNEAAAQRRILRALDKLRHYFAKRGFSSTTAIIAGAISANSVQAAPLALAKSVTVAALSEATIPTVVVLSKGIAFSTAQRILLMTALAGSVGAAVYFHTHFSGKKIQSKDKLLASAGINPVSPALTDPQLNATPAVNNAGNNLDAAIANLQKVLHTRPTSHQMYNYPGITNAIGAFGLDRMSAFRVLLNNSADSEEFVRGGAIAGMGYLGKFLPDASPILWSMVYTPQDRDAWMAFDALKNIGFGPSDLPALTDLLTNGAVCNGTILTKFAPESVSVLISQDPAACIPNVPALENLLTNHDPNTQFRAALALVRYEGTNNPNIFPAIHAVFISPNNRTSEYNKNLASEILAKAGPAALPFVPDLLRFAETASEADVQDATYSTIAQIEPALASQIPQVARFLKQQREDAIWNDKLKSGSYSLDDLRAALRDPTATVTLEAANRLAAMGLAAKATVPEMIHALWGKDEDTRNKILADIYKVDPQATITKIPTSRIITGNLHDFLDRQPPTEQNKRLIQDVYAIELFSGWVLPDEFAAFTNKLAIRNRDAYQVFVRSNK